MAPLTHATVFEECTQLAEAHGIKALNFTWMMENGQAILYRRHRKFDVDLSDVASAAGLAEEWAEEHDIARIIARECRAVYEAEGIDGLCPSWMDRNGHGPLYNKIRCHPDITMRTVARDLGVEDAWVAKYEPDLKSIALRDVSALVDENGIKAVFEKWLRDHGHKTLFHRINFLLGSCEDVARNLGKHKEWLEQRGINRKAMGIANTEARGYQVWTPNRLRVVGREIVEQYDGIPSTGFLRANGHTGFTIALTKFKVSLPDLRTELGAPTLSEMRSMDGSGWLSYSEVALADFLLARGIRVENGTQYPPEFNEQYGCGAVYDMHFVAVTGEHCGKRVDIEVFGGGKMAKSAKYREKRQRKIEFHAEAPTFVSIEHEDCFKGTLLQRMFEPFIGILPVTVTRSEYPDVEPTLWNLTDRVLQQAREIASHMPDASLPGCDWLRRKNKYADREKFAWEKPSYEWFIDQIYMIGGFVKVRALLVATSAEASGLVGIVHKEDGWYAAVEDGAGPFVTPFEAAHAYNTSANRTGPPNVLPEWFDPDGAANKLAADKAELIRTGKALYAAYGRAPRALYSYLHRQLVLTPPQQEAKKLALKIKWDADQLFADYREYCQQAGIPFGRRTRNEPAASQADPTLPTLQSAATPDPR